MPTKDPIKKAEANRERQRRFRAKKVAEESKADSKPVTPHVTQGVTQAEIDQLPMSLKYMVDNETRRRTILKMPLELKERLDMAVRRFRGY
jgi:hypothetical protein